MTKSQCRFSKKHKRSRRQALIVLLILALALGIGLAVSGTGEQNVVIVLDPGHDAAHAGAGSADGLREESLNLKIAGYCKEELETYKGVKVYLTRTDENCPFPGCSEGECLMGRVAYAEQVGATIYVSLHLNWNTDASASGAQIYCPNKNYNVSVSSRGFDLASRIMEQLCGLGLTRNGIYSQDSEDRFYPDGSAGDYWFVIYQSKLAGFPGIIVEHAFLSNASDVDLYLSTEEGLKSLGEADAQGIADYLGLKPRGT